MLGEFTALPWIGAEVGKDALVIGISVLASGSRIAVVKVFLRKIGVRNEARKGAVVL
jgi:hypothetical protein